MRRKTKRLARQMVSLVEELKTVPDISLGWWNEEDEKLLQEFKEAIEGESLSLRSPFTKVRPA